MGAFADGIETSVNNVPVSGTASYSGHTYGLAVKGGTTRDDLDEDAFSESRYFDFLGQVSLQADFATASMRGQVNNFRQEYVDEVEHDFLKDLAIDLGAASIVSGTFTGDARATGGLAGAAGKWGGQFFGTPDAGEAPPAAGGTWGVTQGTGPDDWKMLGGFGAWNHSADWVQHEEAGVARGHHPVPPPRYARHAGFYRPASEGQVGHASL